MAKRPSPKRAAQRTRKDRKRAARAERAERDTGQETRYQTSKAAPSISVTAKTPAQDAYLKSLLTKEQVFVTGPAGTGKTYLAASVAAKLFATRDIDRIILTRPNVPAGRSIGFLPGTLEEKIGPWAVPLISVLEGHLGKARVEIALKRGDIEIVPFEVMRGRTFDNAFVILDEAQNTTPDEMKMFLTRIGEWSRVVVNGDISQTDIGTESGLAVALSLIEAHGETLGMDVGVHHLGLDDIVRSGICGQWTRAFWIGNDTGQDTGSEASGLLRMLRRS